MRNETIWIIAIVAVAVIFLAQSFDISKIPGFIVAGGGAGSSVSQIINPITASFTDYGEPVGTWDFCIARPPVGETWLITDFDTIDSGTDCRLASGDYTELSNWFWRVLTTDRLFIDNNLYLICGDDSMEPCYQMLIVGVRV